MLFHTPLLISYHKCWLPHPVQTCIVEGEGKDEMVQFSSWDWHMQQMPSLLSFALGPEGQFWTMEWKSESYKHMCSNSDSQSVVPIQAASASLENLLDMQMLSILHPQDLLTQKLGWSQQSLFNKLSWGFWCMMKFENHCLKTFSIPNCIVFKPSGS
jgi:hypothetical protein